MKNIVDLFIFLTNKLIKFLAMQNLSISPIHRRTSSPNPSNQTRNNSKGMEEEKRRNSAKTENIHTKMVDIVHLVTVVDEEDGKNPKKLFDAFCDFTSISGFRFLHSRHPLWFRILSALILFGSIFMFFYHSSIYVRRFIDKRNSIQMYTTKVPNMTVPHIIVCPLRQFKSILHYEGPADFIHIISHFYNVPNQIPEIEGITILNLTKNALTFANNYLNITNEANSTNLVKIVEEAEMFSQNKNYKKLFPQCANLMRLKLTKTLANDRSKIYENYANYREWQLHMNDSCFTEIVEIDAELQNEMQFIELIKCRATKMQKLLEEILNRMENFAEYVAIAKPKLEEYVLFCRWLEGGPCVIEWIPSEIGIDCIQIGGQNRMPASYITLRNTIDIVLDLFALDNQMSTWEERELRILLSAEKQSHVCTNYDGFA